MKKTVLVFAIFLVFTGSIFAQIITASPIEGRWEWDKRGEEPDFTEVIFFGNMMLGSDDAESYGGATFTCTGNNISIADGELQWVYRLSGSTLMITDEDDVQYTFRKARSAASPLQGIWQIEIEGERMYFIFTEDIFAISVASFVEGGKIQFRNNTFFAADDPDENIPYNVRGNTLTLTFDGEKLAFTKVY